MRYCVSFISLCQNISACLKLNRPLSRPLSVVLEDGSLQYGGGYSGPQGSHQNKSHCTNKEESMVKIINYKLLQENRS